MSDNRWGPWDVRHASSLLDTRGVDVELTLEQVRSALSPVRHDWLARRLEALWNSHSHSGSLKAVDWLRETGRLLADLPQAVLEIAIDEAVKQAERGFMPNVGEIRAVADPMHAELQTQRQRLEWVIAHRNAPEPTALPEPPKYWRPKPGETQAILAEYGLATAKAETRPTRIPTVEEYMEVTGIDRAAAEKIVARQHAEAKRGSIGEHVTVRS